MTLELYVKWFKLSVLVPGYESYNVNIYANILDLSREMPVRVIFLSWLVCGLLGFSLALDSIDCSSNLRELVLH